MPIAPHHTTIESFEAYLGDPESADGAFSFARSTALDEADEYPSAQCDLLHAWGLGNYYVPASVGGKLASYEEQVGLLRAVARRNLSTAIASGKTFLGAVHVWVAGTEAQKQEVFGLIREGGQLALAYHEKNHGGDFFSVDTAATPTATGYRLSGEKWLVNNATRGVGLTVFARTDPAGGPRGFSILFVNKRELLPGSFSHTPPLRTLGIRGADFSGIKFTDCDLSARALVGELGGGLELSLRSFQLTRTILPGLSLGAGDTALRTVLNFAVKRELYGKEMLALPVVQRSLVNAFVDLLICDCVAISTARAAHVSTEQLRLWSAASKYFVPVTVDELLNKLSAVLGARSYLRDEHDSGIFQKIVRDHGVVRIFHAGTYMLLQTVSLSLVGIAGFRRSATPEKRAAVARQLQQIFSWDVPLAPLDPDRLQVFDTAFEDPLLGLSLSLASLEKLLAAAKPDDKPILQEVSALIRLAMSQGAVEEASYRAGRAELGKSFSQSGELLDLAARYCSLHAVAACVQTWLHNQDGLDEPARRGDWLVLALHRLLSPLGTACVRPLRHHEERVLEQLLAYHREKRAFAMVPIQLPGARR